MKQKGNKEEYKRQLTSTFAEYIKAKGLRQTNERYAILEKIVDLDTHFDIETIYSAMECEYHVSRTTVYSTIDLLCDCNILRKHFINGKQATYDLTDTRHIHLICTQCGSVKEVNDTKINEFISKQKFRGFTQEFSTTYVHGICSKCKRRKLPKE